MPRDQSRHQSGRNRSEPRQRLRGRIPLQQSRALCGSFESNWARHLWSSAGYGGPAFRQEQAQAEHEGHFALCVVTETIVWQFAFLPSNVAYCSATPTEALPFLGRALSSMISQALPPGLPGSTGHFQRGAVPQTCHVEMMQPVIGNGMKPYRHGLNALAIARTDQTGNMSRTHPSPRPVDIPQIRLKPTTCYYANNALQLERYL